MRVGQVIGKHKTNYKNQWISKCPHPTNSYGENCKPKKMNRVVMVIPAIFEVANKVLPELYPVIVLEYNLYNGMIH